MNSTLIALSLWLTLSLMMLSVPYIDMRDYSPFSHVDMLSLGMMTKARLDLSRVTLLLISFQAL